MASDNDDRPRSELGTADWQVEVAKIEDPSELVKRRVLRELS